MGVGVYTNDFNGSGGTFLVSGALIDDEDHRSYVIDVGRDSAETFENWKNNIADMPDPSESDYADYLFECGEDEAADLDTWRQDQVNDEVEGLEYLLSEVCKKIDIPALDCSHNARAAFDSDFVLIGDGAHIQIGWRNWEHDYVIGVGGDAQTKYWGGEPDAHAGEIMEETGLAPSTYASIYADLSSKVQDYVRLSLMQQGIECRFRTSGYTTGLYEAPGEGYEATLDTLASEIKELNGRLSSSFEDGLDAASDKERIEIAKELLSGDHNTTLRAAVLLYDPEQDDLKLFTPLESRLLASIQMNDLLKGEISETLSSLDDPDDFIAIPRNERTQKVFSDLQCGRMDDVIISVAEWKAVDGDDLAIEWTDDSGDRFSAGIVFGDAVPHPAP